MISMAEFLTSKFSFVVPMIVGGIAYWWMLRLMSISVHLPWSAIWDELKKGNVAVGLYCGLRALAVAVAMGLFAIAGTDF